MSERLSNLIYSLVPGLMKKKLLFLSLVVAAVLSSFFWMTNTADAKSEAGIYNQESLEEEKLFRQSLNSYRRQYKESRLKDLSLRQDPDGLEIQVVGIRNTERGVKIHYKIIALKDIYVIAPTKKIDGTSWRSDIFFDTEEKYKDDLYIVKDAIDLGHIPQGVGWPYAPPRYKFMKIKKGEMTRRVMRIRKSSQEYLNFVGKGEKLNHIKNIYLEIGFIDGIKMDASYSKQDDDIKKFITAPDGDLLLSVYGIPQQRYKKIKIEL